MIESCREIWRYLIFFKIEIWKQNTQLLKLSQKNINTQILASLKKVPISYEEECSRKKRRKSCTFLAK
jgi:hypothetical protein